MKSVHMSFLLVLLLLQGCVAFVRHVPRVVSKSSFEETQTPSSLTTQLSRTTGEKLYGEALLNSRKRVLKDILGLGPAGSFTYHFFLLSTPLYSISLC